MMVGVGNPFNEKIVGLIVRSGNMGGTTVLARLYADGGNPMTGRPYSGAGCGRNIARHYP